MVSNNTLDLDEVYLSTNTLYPSSNAKEERGGAGYSGYIHSAITAIVLIGSLSIMPFYPDLGYVVFGIGGSGVVAVLLSILIRCGLARQQTVVEARKKEKATGRLSQKIDAENRIDSSGDSSNISKWNKDEIKIIDFSVFDKQQLRNFVAELQDIENVIPEFDGSQIQYLCPFFSQRHWNCVVQKQFDELELERFGEDVRAFAFAWLNSNPERLEKAKAGHIQYICHLFFSNEQWEKIHSQIEYLDLSQFQDCTLRNLADYLNTLQQDKVIDVLRPIPTKRKGNILQYLNFN